MNSASLRAKVWLVSAGIVLVAGGVLVYGWQRLQDAGPTTTNTNTSTRETYAALYDIAFRADAGQGSVLMTATILLPSMIDALGNDSTRSDVEDGLYRAIRDLPENQMAFFVTTDSRIGSLSEEQITTDLNLTSKPSQDWRFLDWQSMITLKGIADTNSGVTPQTGVVIFETDETINWSSMTEVVLTKRNLADVPERRFVWTEPTLRLAVVGE